jgi:hypothetical protein
MVSMTHASVNERGVGEHLHPYQNKLESAEKKSTRNRSWSQSKSRSPAQRSGSGALVSVRNANGPVE